MKKHYFLFLTCICSCIFSFTACSSDDDNGGTVSMVSEDLKPFVGYWDITPSTEDKDHRTISAYMFQEKKVLINGSKTFHDWSYDSSSKILAFANEPKGQWQITAIFENSWSALSLWDASQIGYTAEKRKGDEFFVLMSWLKTGHGKMMRHLLSF